jgi:hypothetical protein
MNKKRGQMQMSFGTIFSIILIIIFIAFAVYGVSKFLGVSNLAKVEKFKSDFQSDINTMWKSTQGSQELEYSVPNKIEQVCFTDGEFENMYFLPQNSDYEGYTLDNVDITKTIEDSKSNPKKLCMDTEDGKISLTIKKAYNENLVTITE